MVAITLSLTKAQLNRLDKGLGVRASAKQLQSGDQELDVSEEMAKKVVSAQRRGKGCDIHSLHVDGGSLKSVRKSFTKAGKKINRTFTKFGNDFADEAPGILEQSKKYISKAALQQIASAAVIAGTAAIGQPQLAVPATVAVKSAIDAGYSTKIDERGFGKRYGKNFGKAMINNGLVAGAKSLTAKPPTEGAGLVRRPLKGSQEAKDYMAALRARKGGVKAQPAMETSGAGFISTGTSGRTEGRGFISTGRGFVPTGRGIVEDTKGHVLTMADNIERKSVQYSQVASLDSKGGRFILRKQNEIHGKGFMNV